MKKFILFLIILSVSLYGQTWELTSIEPSYIEQFYVMENGDVYGGYFHPSVKEFFRFNDSEQAWENITYNNIFEGFICKTNSGAVKIIDRTRWNYSDSVILGLSGKLFSINWGQTWDTLNVPGEGRSFLADSVVIFMQFSSSDIAAADSNLYYKVSLEDKNFTKIEAKELPFNRRDYSVKSTLDTYGNLVLMRERFADTLYRYNNSKWDVITTPFYRGWVSHNYILTDSALYKFSYDGDLNLQELKRGIGKATEIYTQNDNVYILLETGELLKYDTVNDTLTSFKKGIAGQSVTDMQSMDGILYAYVDNSFKNYIYKSTNNGAGWELLNIPESLEGPGNLLVADSVIILGSLTNNDTEIDPSYISYDKGQNWEIIRTKESYSRALKDMAADGVNIIASEKSVARERQVFTSPDGGKNWNFLVTAEWLTSALYTKHNEYLIAIGGNKKKVYIAADSLNIDTTLTPAEVSGFTSINSRYFGATDQGVVKLERNVSAGKFYKAAANEWVFTGLEGKKILSLTSDSLGVVYAGTEDGTYFSADSGSTWEVYGTVVSGNLKKTSSTGLSQVKALLVNGSELFAAANEGLYKTKTYGAIGINEEPNITVTGFKLAQNYPNPFNPETNISFTLPKAGHVKLTVYNALGQQVEQLVNRELGQGSYNYKFDGRKLSSGVYIYSLEAGTFRTAKKMMLIK